MAITLNDRNRPQTAPSEPGAAPPRQAETTLTRFWQSPHLIELRHILFGVVPLAVLAAFAAVAVSPHLTDPASAFTFAGAALSAAVGVVVWVYRTANDRLGVVDLIAGEISTLCRVCTVADVIKRFTEHLDNPNDPGFAKTAPSEIYTIIFDSNSRQLAVFDKKVIRNVTQFYTYIKAFRDAIRGLVALHEEEKPSDPAERAQYERAWRGTLINVVYVLFLALESGRGAIKELVEDDELSIEWTITVLLSEFSAFAFLLDHHFDDLKGPQLELRYPVYRRLKGEIFAEGGKWQKSRGALKELETRWHDVERAWNARAKEREAA